MYSKAIELFVVVAGFADDDVAADADAAAEYVQRY